ncbi:MAG: methylated-DNA--[protein]-cysteine S-methyltransferase [Rhizobiaceae bacterium]
MNSHVFDTALGFFGLGWNENGLARLVLPEPDADRVAARLADARPASPQGWVCELVEEIGRYAQGEQVGFDRFPVQFGAASTFDQAIWMATRRLGHGEVTTYGELAARAGFPGQARPVGAALGRNPVPLLVPCHRVLAAGGRLGGFSAPGGAGSKARLLLHERADTAPALPGQQAFSF